MPAAYRILAEEGRAKRAVFSTKHGDIHTPVFMNVATAAAIKGALSAEDLRAVGCQVALCNTYHLHLRPGEGVVRAMGGLRRFMAWDGPVLTDSGGFQVFSLAALRRITEEGVHFASHIDGHKIFMGPEESIAIQHALGATIAMAFDECVPFPSERGYVQASADRTARWLERCFSKREQLEAPPLLFAINQGGVYTDIRAEHAKRLSQTDADGFALGGLAVGETHEQMYEVLEETVPCLPRHAPTYLMGVGTPENILEAVSRGVDFFDCVLPARNGRHAHVYTSRGKLNLLNARHERAEEPIDDACGCAVCRTHSRAYLRHLFKAKEMLAMRLCVIHNLFYYNGLMRRIREALEAGRFNDFKRETEDMWGCNSR